MDFTQDKLRNFCIIAHIDHGKSTLADRFLEVTHTIDARMMGGKKQVLDRMDLEQEKGITIKLQPVRMEYQGFMLNLIDTPGHVDFSYEVSRSLAACEGAILIVDATQGIQAQTLANLYLALEHDLTIIPVVNKIDLDSAEPERVAEEIERVIGIPKEEVLFVSAKTGIGVEAVLERVIRDVPAPKGDASAPTRAMVFDSQYDAYKGVLAYVRIIDGSLSEKDSLLLMSTQSICEIVEIGTFNPEYERRPMLRTGEVGYIATGLKSVRDIEVGDTVTIRSNPAQVRIPGYRKVKPMVFAGVYPIDGEKFTQLREALEKLRLSDSALSYEPEASSALGNGFRCGFLGLLHLEIVQERLEREYQLELITTAPSVAYIATMRGKQGEDYEVILTSADDFPDPSSLLSLAEPWSKLTVITPSEYLGGVIDLVTKRRGALKNTEYLDEKRVTIHFEIPLAEILVDFYNDLKSTTSGYASMDYEFLSYKEGDLVKLDILIADEVVSSLGVIVPRSRAAGIGRAFLAKLKDVIPKQLFLVKLQASIGSKVIARENISAMRKDVTSKLYGGDYSRKRKLLEKQKKGKKRMKMVGKVSIPQEAFMAVLTLKP